MLQLAFLCLATGILVVASNIQVPVGSNQRSRHNPYSTSLGDEILKEWSLNNSPNPNGTDHLVFETVHSLLQHWPNTRMRNGHNIVPGIIPKGTLLYHGTNKNEVPPGPEWVATDPEHSYFICRSESEIEPVGAECWFLTLATTRPLKVVYFDGSSAVEIPYGSIDTQLLLVRGKSGPQDPMGEMQLIRDLCEWGKNFDVDGFVRMELDFEVMLCDFTSGVTVVSFANLVIFDTSELALTSFVEFEAMNAGSWHNHFPGETRIHLDLARFVSFYDTQLVPSLIDIRAGRERWDHRARDVSSEDLSALKSRLEGYLMRPADLSSGIDWQTVIQVIVDRYAQRLELMRHFLNSSTTEPDEMLSLTKNAQLQLRIMLTPYLLLSAASIDGSDEDGLDWTIPIYKLCATAHTDSMDSELGSMTESEKLILRSVRGTTREICRVVTRMWAAGVHAGVDPALNTKESLDFVDVAHLWNTWTEDLKKLMAWLDWSVWIKCDPGCGPEEMCWLPTWPIGFPPDLVPKPSSVEQSRSSGLGSDIPHVESLASSNSNVHVIGTEILSEEMRITIKPGPNDWIRPQPRCVRRTEPYGY